jgi:hypothetical protein
MDALSVVLILFVFIVSLLLVRALVGPGAWRSSVAALKRNRLWMVALLAATAAEYTFNRTIPHHPYLVTMSPTVEPWSGLPTALQATVPATLGIPLFSLAYIVAYLVLLVAVPLFLLASGRDGLFKRYSLSIVLAYAVLVALHLA